MKKLLYLIYLLPAWLQAQTPTQEGFVVQGNIKGLGNSQITVIKIIGDDFDIDHITSHNDRFTYRGQVEEPYFVQLLLKKDSVSRKLCEFMLENSQITITGSATAYDSVQVSGSKSNEVLKKYFAEDNLLDAKWDRLKLEYDKYTEAGDTLNRKRVARQLNHILQVEKVALLKRYVKQYNDQIVGALLPNFCTLKDVLTSADYAEMYEMLTPAIQQSGYGQSIRELAQQADK